MQNQISMRLLFGSGLNILLNNLLLKDQKEEAKKILELEAYFLKLYINLLQVLETG
jgi:hypothetical protein